jgi:hypothetical protein
MERNNRKFPVNYTAPGRDLNGVSGMANQTADDMPLVAKASGCQAQVLLKVIEVRAADIPQLHAFEVRPDALVGIEIGSVARQLLQQQSLGCILGQEFLDGLGAVDRRTVPDHQQLARDMSHQVLEEADHLGATERVVLARAAAGDRSG